jgi:hypothetical protein
MVLKPSIDAKYEYALQITLQQGYYQTILHKQKILMELIFGFILLLALGAIIDLHVKLRRPDMEVEGHEETLLDVVIFCESRPATPEVLFAVAVIPHLHLIGDATARLLAKDSLSQFASIHEIGKIQRQALNLTALRHGNAEERENFGRSSRNSRRRSSSA